MSTKSRQVIYGGRVIGAKIRAEGAREEAKKAVAMRPGRFRWKAFAGQRGLQFPDDFFG